MKQLKQFLQEINACQTALEWAGERTIEEVVRDCHRGDWLLWLAKKIDIDIRLLTLAKGKCAETVIHLMKDDRSKAAVKAAIDYGNGLIGDDELKAAASAAYTAAAAAAAAAAADYAADAAAAADAYAAAYAAAASAAYTVAADYAADADADAAAYTAAYTAAASAAYAAYTAAADYAADADADAAAAAASKNNEMQTADICREILGNQIIQIVNSKIIITMKQINSDFSKAKVGDPVYHLNGSVGKIVFIQANSFYPIQDNNGAEYTIDGKYYPEDIAPTIFTHPVKIIHADDEPFKERVMEVSNNGESWEKRVAFMERNGHVLCWTDVETIEEAKKVKYATTWKYAREIQQVKPRIAEIESLMQELQNEYKTLKGQETK